LNASAHETSSETIAHSALGSSDPLKPREEPSPARTI